jgi:hypothetical protein
MDRIVKARKKISERCLDDLRASHNFELLLAEWTDVLAAVRAPFKAGVTWKTGTDDRRGSAALIPATSECRVSTDAGRAEDECRKPSQFFECH